MSILFVNGSPNARGNTARLAAELLAGREYETLNLAEHKVYEDGQRFDDDQFSEAMDRVFAADTLVLGSPCYWHNMSGMLRNFLDRHYNAVSPEALAGKRLAFVFQGEGPAGWMFDATDYTVKRYASLYGMEYLGMASDAVGARALSKRL